MYNYILFIYVNRKYIYLLLYRLHNYAALYSRQLMIY